MYPSSLNGIVPFVECEAQSSPESSSGLDLKTTVSSLIF